MIQLNVNTLGDPGKDPVEWVIDNGHRYTGIAESPARMIFKSTQVEPSPFGSGIMWRGQQLARLIVPPDGYVGEVAGAPCEMTPPNLTFQAPVQPFQLPQIVGDHFELSGNRWVWRMTDGFLDHQRLYLGQEQAVRDLYKQAQDLDSRGRRVFGMVKFIPGDLGLPAFDPRVDPVKFFATQQQLIGIAAEYNQPLNYVVFADADALGMSLGWCQQHWAQSCANLTGKAFITLVNQWNHAGNLVGQPNDYQNPGGLASQGSANEDTNPPNPTDGTGTGYQFWEWCSSQTPTHLSHEYFIWKGLSTGRVMPCVISEPGKRLEEGAVDLDAVRTLTHASMANGLGLTIHSTPGKYSQLMGPNIANATRLSMSLLAAGQA